MGLDLIPKFLRDNYDVREWRHAVAVLATDYPAELKDIIEVLTAFRLKKSHIIVGGGGKSKVSTSIDKPLYDLGWVERGFDTKVVIDQTVLQSPTHKIDCFRNCVGLEVEWNNKDPFFDRDLNNFRLLFELRALAVGVIVTRCDELQDIFDELGRGDSYGGPTTHLGKLLPKIEGGGAGGCPLLVFGISKKLYEPGA